jgi:receptor protein-tyrosine kinase
VGTIEQAAKRLEQLRKAGVDIGSADTDGQPASTSSPEPLPMRVAKELEARAVVPASADAGVGQDGTAARPVSEAAVKQVADAAPVSVREGLTLRSMPSRTHVDIDLPRLSANGYVTPQAPRSRLAEEFRVIKRPLLTNARGKPAAPVLNANRIMVTSSVAGEGKTYVSVNLAMSLAMELDTHVLLVDADASRPAVLERLGLPPSKGLLDLLVEPSLQFDSVVLSTNVERLSILPTGSPQAQSTELLASDAMHRLVDRLTMHDPRLLVVFDSPPLLGASESRVLAAQMGQVILVVAADDTPQGTVAEALATVENCPVVLTLLNRASQSDRGHYYGSYGAHAH